MTRASLVDRSVGSVHTGFGLCALAEGGSLDTHVHSFEELFYILEGSPILVLDGHAVELAARRLRRDSGGHAPRLARP